LFDTRYTAPALSDVSGYFRWFGVDAFNYVQAIAGSWSSIDDGGTGAWGVRTFDASRYHGTGSSTFYVWPVRSGN